MHPARLPFALACLLAAAPTLLPAATVPTGFVDEIVSGGLSAPMSLRFLPDGRMLVSERSPATIQVLSADGSVRLGSALSIANVPGDGERGLLSFEIDPDWPARPYLYAYFAEDSAGNRLVLARYTGSGDLDGDGDGTLAFADELPLLSGLPDLCFNHNGGDLRFLPDGTLLLSVGDDENQCAAQDRTSPLGKLLRLDVSALPASDVQLSDLAPVDNPFAASIDAVERLVYTYGLRNPFRFHVDASDGSVFVADVGSFWREEISHVEIPGSNLGWPYVEGSFARASVVNSCSCHDCGCVRPQDFAAQLPIDEYDQGIGRSIMSAGVVRNPQGGASPWPYEYTGDYFYADFYAGILRRLKGSGQNWTMPAPVPGQPALDAWATDLGIGSVDFQFGPDGSLYYLNLYQGLLKRIRSTQPVPAPPAVGMLALRAQPSVMRDRTLLSFGRSFEHSVEIALFDVAGRAVRRLVVPAGLAQVAWDGLDERASSVPAGVYFARLRDRGAVVSTRIVKLP